MRFARWFHACVDCDVTWQSETETSDCWVCHNGSDLRSPSLLDGLPAMNNGLLPEDLWRNP